MARRRRAICGRRKPPCSPPYGRGCPSRRSAAGRLFDLAVRADGGVQEARRAAHSLLGALDKSMAAEFGRILSARDAAADALREARDRSEARGLPARGRPRLRGRGTG
jgi:hypothetical protein